MCKFYIKICLVVISIFSSANIMAREYGEIMTVHSGDANASGVSIVECHVKIKREIDNIITGYLKVESNTGLYQPTGCAVLLSAYVSGKRIGYDLTVDNKFTNICLADKIDC